MQQHRSGKICWAKRSQFQLHQSFHGNILYCLGQKCSLFSIIKERCLYSQKIFRGTPENCEKCENLAQGIFPDLQYHIDALVFLFDLRCESVTFKNIYIEM